MAISPVRRYNDREQIDVEPPRFSEAEAAETLNRLISRPDFIAQIPQASGKGLELANIRTWLRAARELKQQVDIELSSGD